MRGKFVKALNVDMSCVRSLLKYCDGGLRAEIVDTIE
jgi:hypothetical protein